MTTIEQMFLRFSEGSPLDPEHMKALRSAYYVGVFDMMRAINSASMKGELAMQMNVFEAELRHVERIILENRAAKVETSSHD